MRGGGTARNLLSMAIELERKFLVTGEGWRHQVQAPGQGYRQGYLAKGDVTVRVRIRGNNEGASLTIKGRRRGIMRLEFEYAIPVADAETLLRKLAPHSLVEKTRFKLRYRGHAWSVDEFQGRHAGLVLAEIELPHPCALFDVPDWVGQDVTSEERYSNSFLAQMPSPTEIQVEQLPLPFAAEKTDAPPVAALTS
jgi:adenylate cyclase